MPFDPLQLNGLSILGVRGESIPFSPNRVQLDFCKWQSGRDIILKSRQMGITTLIQAMIYHQVSTYQNYQAITLPHHAVTLSRLSERFNHFHERNPLLMYRPRRNYFSFPQLGSSYYLTGKFPVGDSFDLIHMNELAYRENGMRELEHFDTRRKNGWAIIESTINPHNLAFMKLCIGALSNWNGWRLHFYEWWWDDRYQLPIYEPLKFDKAETELMEQKGLTPEQINWRRRRIQQLGPENFQREYPESVEVCLGLK